MRAFARSNLKVGQLWKFAAAAARGEDPPKIRLLRANARIPHSRMATAGSLGINTRNGRDQLRSRGRQGRACTSKSWWCWRPVLPRAAEPLHHDLSAGRWEHIRQCQILKNDETNPSLNYAGSRINFWPLSRSQSFERVFRWDFKVCFARYPTDITLWVYSFKPYPTSTIWSISFHGLFFEKETSGGDVLLLWASLLLWSWGQLLPQSKTFPSRLLGLLEKRSNFCRYSL